MTKRELARIIGNRLGVRVDPEMYLLMNETFAVILETMADGQTVKIPEFGEFSARTLAPRQRHDFRGGVQPAGSPVKVPHLRFYKAAKDVLNGREK